ncbi:MAG: tripartite tricarboxylate transporter substrate binding protein [Betaproteobacteria bacterium]|nr:tripartite tricarboxylate transporter substrate binding protein [Betaproteobacteria bacterium]
MQRSLLLAIAVALASGLPVTASAQTFPSKPIRIVVPFPAGGTSDILTRLIGSKMNEAWGQQVLADNRPGANGNIGADMVARAAPDGHTLVLMDVGNLAISPSVFAKLPFDIIKDFAPVTVVSYSPHILATHPSMPAKTVKEIITLAKARPGKLNYATGLGGAPHMAGLMFAYRSGINWAYIPTKGGFANIMLVTTGEADLLFNGMLATLPHTKSGRLRLIAVSSEKRFPTLPDTPVVAETPGLDGFVTGSWQGVLAPAKTPPELVTRLQTEIARIIHTPDMKEKLSTQGADPIGNSPAEMAKWLAAEKDRWAKLIKATGFKLEN